jgi:peptidoglycan hydrolase-like protein with peptidoglycan-binding domain
VNNPVGFVDRDGCRYVDKNGFVYEDAWTVNDSTPMRIHVYTIKGKGKLIYVRNAGGNSYDEANSYEAYYKDSTGLLHFGKVWKWEVTFTTPCAPGSSTGSSLKYKSTGAEVKKLQQRLIELGYLAKGYDTGNYLDKTVTAVKAFQAANGLSADGVAGIKTLTALYSSTDKSKSKAASTTTSSGKVRTLKYGCKGDDVVALQDRLRELGLFTGKSTGNFYSVTRDAVVAFQKKNGLTADGVVGPKTREALGLNK